MNVITGIGLVSALGLDSSTSLAAARAGLVRSAALRTINSGSEDFLNGSPMVGYCLPCGVGEGFVGAPKALVLGQAAILDLLSGVDVSTLGRVGLYVVLSNYFVHDSYMATDQAVAQPLDRPSARWQAATSRFADRLVAGTDLDGNARARVYYAGHAGVAQALADAQRDVADEQVDACVIGAIDSCVEPRFLRAAAGAGLLKTELVPTGLMPGEAAAFFLLESPRTARDDKLPVALAGLGLGADRTHLLAEEPPTGVGLAAAVEQCLEQLPPADRQDIELVISDCNGDERRALEWGYCLVRLRSRYAVGAARLWLPAMSFGETGCATGAVAICMAVRGLQRGYARTRQILVALSSDDGLKASVCLSRRVIN